MLKSTKRLTGINLERFLSDMSILIGQLVTWNTPYIVTTELLYGPYQFQCSSKHVLSRILLPNPAFLSKVTTKFKVLICFKLPILLCSPAGAFGGILLFRRELFNPRRKSGCLIVLGVHL